MIRRPLTCIVVLFLLSGQAMTVFADHGRLLLVTSNDSEIGELNKNELRRLFLGMPVHREGRQLKPLLNKSDDRGYQIFLQAVIGMSQKRYERTLISGLYRQGYNAPPVYTRLEELLQTLNAGGNTLSFIYDHGQLEAMSFSIVQEIWISEKE